MFVIKVKDPWLHQINIAVPGFLTGPPFAGTQPVDLPIQRAPKEDATSSNTAPKEEAPRVVEVVDSSEDTDKEFRVFDQPLLARSLFAPFSQLPSTQVSINQNFPSVPSAVLSTMVPQRKQKTNLFELLESHVGGSVPEVAVQPRPLTPIPTYTSPFEPVDK